MTGGLNPLSLLSSILLGLIQGLAEFLPISSSGHLAIAEHFLGQAGVPATPDFFDVLLHLGTLVAVFAAYWQDIRDMIVELIDGVRDLVRGTTPNPIPPARRMILLIIVGDVYKRQSPPFTTSTMQQEASRKLSMTPRRTMAIAQQLYEGVDITGEGPPAI